MNWHHFFLLIFFFNSQCGEPCYFVLFSLFSLIANQLYYDRFSILPYERLSTPLKRCAIFFYRFSVTRAVCPYRPARSNTHKTSANF